MVRIPPWSRLSSTTLTGTLYSADDIQLRSFAQAYLSLHGELLEGKRGSISVTSSVRSISRHRV